MMSDRRQERSAGAWHDSSHRAESNVADNRAPRSLYLVQCHLLGQVSHAK